MPSLEFPSRRRALTPLASVAPLLSDSVSASAFRRLAQAIAVLCAPHSFHDPAAWLLAAHEAVSRVVGAEYARLLLSSAEKSVSVAEGVEHPIVGTDGGTVSLALPSELTRALEASARAGFRLLGQRAEGGARMGDRAGEVKREGLPERRRQGSGDRRRASATSPHAGTRQGSREELSPRVSTVRCTDDALREQFGLTAREIDVARALTGTATVPQIAARLGVSVHTLRRHSERVYRKLRVNSRREATERLTGSAG